MQLVKFEIGTQVDAEIDYCLKRALLLKKSMPDRERSRKRSRVYASVISRASLPPILCEVESDLGKRTVESIIVHHADFVSFDPFRPALTIKN